MAVLGVIFLSYVMLGPWLPDALATGSVAGRLVSHMAYHRRCLRGRVGRIAFLYLCVCVAGVLARPRRRRMMQVSFALLGHFRGGPAKVAVVSSGMNSIVSASSVATWSPPAFSPSP